MKRERSSTITSIEDDIELEEREIKTKVKVPAIEAEIAPESSPEEGEEEEKRKLRSNKKLKRLILNSNQPKNHQGLFIQKFHLVVISI